MEAPGGKWWQWSSKKSGLVFQMINSFLGLLGGNGGSLAKSLSSHVCCDPQALTFEVVAVFGFFL